MSRPCAECGAPIPEITGRGGHNRTTCSDVCGHQRKNRQMREAAARRHAARRQPCTRCGSPVRKMKRAGEGVVPHLCGRCAQRDPEALAAIRAWSGERQKKHIRSQMVGTPESHIARNLQTIRARAWKRGYEFSISLADLMPLPARCDCGVTLAYCHGGGSPREDSPSVNRIDSTKGYVPGNVEILCLRCNKFLSDATWAEGIAAHVRFALRSGVSPAAIVALAVEAANAIPNDFKSLAGMVSVPLATRFHADSAPSKSGPEKNGVGK